MKPKIILIINPAIGTIIRALKYQFEVKKDQTDEKTVVNSVIASPIELTARTLNTLYTPF